MGGDELGGRSVQLSQKGGRRPGERFPGRLLRGRADFAAVFSNAGAGSSFEFGCPVSLPVPASR